jgi:hypothetical protein
MPFLEILGVLIFPLCANVFKCGLVIFLLPIKLFFAHNSLNYAKIRALVKEILNRA